MLVKELESMLFYTPRIECIKVENCYPDRDCGTDIQNGKFFFEKIPEVNRRALQEKAAELVVVWETDPLINNAVMVRDDLSPALVADVRALLVDMAAQDLGRALLQRLAIERFNPADDARYRVAMQRFHDEYRGRVGPLP